jgi:hypothetical protein
MGVAAGLMLGSTATLWYVRNLPHPPSVHAQTQAIHSLPSTAPPPLPLPPPQALPDVELAADASLPPISLPPGALPPLPPGPGAMQADNPIPGDGSVTQILPMETPAPPVPTPRSHPPKASAIEKVVRKVTGVRSVAWGSGSDLYVLVSGVSPSVVSHAACANIRALAGVDGVVLKVQAVDATSSASNNSVEKKCD